jgi:hypothetical protein
MPFGDRLQHVIGIVAIGAGEQLAHVDEDDLMPRAVRDEDAFQAHVVVPWMLLQRHGPDRLGTSRRGG